MAVFYNYIKGCGKDATVPKDQLASAKSKTYTTDSWSFLKWTDKLYYTKDPVEDFKYFENNPIISFNNQPSFISDSANNPDASSYSTGRILTSAARGQYTCYDLSFKNGPGSDKSTTFYQDSNTFYTETSDWTINDDKDNTIIHLYGPNSITSSDYNAEKKKSIVEVGGSYGVEINKSLKVGTTLDTHSNGGVKFLVQQNNICLNGSVSLAADEAVIVPSTEKSPVSIKRNLEIDSSKYCQAGYFNATSDARAKENIRKADFSALSIVNSLPIYNFNYKDSEKPSIGVIAQEAAEFNVDDFSLVENIEATGENNDYMSIKESKLIYILWKAIQEQQKEIEELKSQLRGDK